MGLPGRTQPGMIKAPITLSLLQKEQEYASERSGSMVLLT